MNQLIGNGHTKAIMRNGNYDQYLDRSIPGGNVGNWGQAKDRAHSHSWLQQKGYLATITSPAENHFIGYYSINSNAIRTRAWPGGRTTDPKSTMVAGEPDNNRGGTRNNQPLTSHTKSRQRSRINLIA